MYIDTVCLLLDHDYMVTHIKAMYVGIDCAVLVLLHCHLKDIWNLAGNATFICLKMYVQSSFICMFLVKGGLYKPYIPIRKISLS